MYQPYPYDVELGFSFGKILKKLVTAPLKIAKNLVYDVPKQILRHPLDIKANLLAPIGAIAGPLVSSGSGSTPQIVSPAPESTSASYSSSLPIVPAALPAVSYSGYTPGYDPGGGGGGVPGSPMTWPGMDTPTDVIPPEATAPAVSPMLLIGGAAVVFYLLSRKGKR